LNPPELDRERDYLWLKPEVVGEVSFLEWTPGGEIRHPVFHAIL
jgi:bifunctional non-homologous end joining protein LigD